MSDENNLLAVIRVRGKVNVRKGIEDTLKHLRLNRVNHCILLEETKENRGMLTKVNDYVTWGPVDKKTLVKLLKKRGMLSGDKPLSEENNLKVAGFKSVDELAQALIKFDKTLKDIPNAKPVFRLNPPVGGHRRKGVKKPVSLGGALGNRGKDVNKLLEAMI